MHRPRRAVCHRHAHRGMLRVLLSLLWAMWGACQPQGGQKRPVYAHRVWRDTRYHKHCHVVSIVLRYSTKTPIDRTRNGSPMFLKENV